MVDPRSAVFGVNGYLRIKGTQTFVANATISLESEDGLSRFTTTTNRYGYFVLKVPLTTYNVAITHIEQCGTQTTLAGVNTVTADQPNLWNFFVERSCP